MSKIRKDFGKMEVYLNIVTSHFGLTRPCQVGSTSELIRNSNAKNFEDWEKYYWDNAYAKRVKEKDRYKITQDIFNTLATKGYNFTKDDIPSLTLDTWKEYIYDVTLRRTWDGHSTELAIKEE